MKAYLIDPYKETVTEVEHGDDYKEIYKLIGCDTFDLARVEPNGDSVYVDDNGLLTMQPDSKFFHYKGYHSPLVGKGLMLGVNRAGDSVSPKTKIEVVRSKIRFLDLAQARALTR